MNNSCGQALTSTQLLILLNLVTRELNEKRLSYKIYGTECLKNQILELIVIKDKLNNINIKKLFTLF